MPRRRRRSLTAAVGLAGALLLAAGIAGLSGCSTLDYYAQAASGHLALLSRARPVPEVLAETSTPAALRARLELSQRMRDFASSELGLPANNSYRRYADLQRESVVWNVVAAPALSMTLKTWCFPVMGCVGYRGYFARDAADRLADELRAAGWEVGIYGVPAYSTLGWSNLAGGDPLLNTFVNWPEGDLARLIFHELAHQVVYATDDTTFNESFAVAVERIGGERWLALHASATVREHNEQLEARRRDFRAFVQRWRAELEKLYASDVGDHIKLQRKAQLMDALRSDFAQMKTERWGGFAGYDAWLAQANNASFGVLAAYNELVPQFEALFQRERGDFTRFYAEVQALAALPRDQRRAKLAGSQ